MLEDRRETQAWEIASADYRRSAELLAPLNAERFQPRETDEPVRRISLTPEAPIDAKLAWEASPAPSPEPDMASLWRAQAEAYEAHSRLRRAYARRLESLAAVDADIARWEAQRRSEASDLSPESQQRISDAWNAYGQEAAAFDAFFRDEMRALEARTRPGFFVRLWRALFGPGEAM